MTASLSSAYQDMSAKYVTPLHHFYLGLGNLNSEYVRDRMYDSASPLCDRVMLQTEVVQT